MEVKKESNKVIKFYRFFYQLFVKVSFSFFHPKGFFDKHFVYKVDKFIKNSNFLFFYGSYKNKIIKFYDCFTKNYCLSKFVKQNIVKLSFLFFIR